MVKINLLVLLIVGLCSLVSGQTKCFSEEDSERIILTVNAPQNVRQNTELRRELVAMRDALQKLKRKVIEDWEDNSKFVANANELGEKYLLRLCQIVKENGWVSEKLVGEKGLEAALYLVKNNRAFELQREFFPVILAAAQKGEVDSSDIAWLIDSLRVSAGWAQIFGTQAEVKDGWFYFYPLFNKTKVDEWRKNYNLPPLSPFIKRLEIEFQMPAVIMPRLPISPKLKGKNQPFSPTGAAKAPILDLSEEEIVKVETNLVNLNVRVKNIDPTSHDDSALEKKDFIVFEDGQQQEITFFSEANAPFDLILLLDLSGSTSGKHDLIYKSTRRFIEAARPSDRIAVVVFTGEAKILSNLTGDKQALLKSLKKDVRTLGGSKVWDALQFTYDEIIKTQSTGRRSAVVFMTDGIDNSLIQQFIGSKSGVVFGEDRYTPSVESSNITFAQLLETVRRGETTIFPIYLDRDPDHDWAVKAFQSGRRTLWMLAEESGGQMYSARKIEDLTGIYEKIIEDLGRVYSLGYQPKNETRDGSWRSLTIKIPNRQNLTVRTKSGYYAK